MRTTVLLTRHGETIWNKEKKVQGNIDIPLSQEGVKQAKLLAKRLKEYPVTQIHTSKLSRAFDTGQIIANTLGISVVKKHKGLNERSMGIYEGASWPQIDEEFRKQGKSFFLNKPENGESGKELHDRVVKAFDEIVLKNQGETILIVCHGGVLRVLVRHLKSLPIEHPLELDFGNTSLSIFSFEGEQIIEELLADMSHLL